MSFALLALTLYYSSHDDVPIRIPKTFEADTGLEAGNDPYSPMKLAERFEKINTITKAKVADALEHEREDLSEIGRISLLTDMLKV